MTGQDRPVEATWKDALETCMKALKEGQGRQPLAADVEKWLWGVEESIFQKNFPIWASVRGQVIAASNAVGQIAAILASLAGSNEISEAVLRSAIHAVRLHCLARGEREDKVDRRQFCPDV
jgi:hypothetical protein